VTKERIRRLYESEASGLLDEELLEEVGITLYLRCLSILEVEDVKRGQVHCPRCARAGHESLIARDGRARDESLCCPVCGWSLAWSEYASSSKRRQLNLGGAGDAFRAYVADYAQATDPGSKMLLIDRLIHAFHYSLRAQPDLPTRAAGVNLIEGRVTDVVGFLDTLTYGQGTRPELVAVRAAWRREQTKIPWLSPPDGLGGEDD
jgi:hypothetical protein